MPSIAALQHLALLAAHWTSPAVASTSNNDRDPTCVLLTNRCQPAARHLVQILVHRLAPRLSLNRRTRSPSHPLHTNRRRAPLALSHKVVQRLMGGLDATRLDARGDRLEALALTG